MTCQWVCTYCVNTTIRRWTISNELRIERLPWATIAGGSPSSCWAKYPPKSFVCIGTVYLWFALACSKIEFVIRVLHHLLLYVFCTRHTQWETSKMKSYDNSWIGHGLQSGPTLAFSLWLSEFKTNTNFGFLIKKNQGSFFVFFRKIKTWARTAKNGVFLWF